MSSYDALAASYDGLMADGIYRRRADYLEKACDIILRHQPADTPAGIVRNIGREGQEVTVLTLGELRKMRLDMFCTVFVGNSQTRNIHGKLVTPRGYHL